MSSDNLLVTIKSACLEQIFLCKCNLLHLLPKEHFQLLSLLYYALNNYENSSQGSEPPYLLDNSLPPSQSHADYI